MKVKAKPIIIVAILAFYLLATLPLAFERVAGGRSAERQGYTAGIIRMYCRDPGHSILSGPEIHFGNNPFNLELTVFEWLQGAVIRGIGGSECNTAVEVTAKIVSILFSAFGVFMAAWLAFELWGEHAAVLAAFLLATDELWLRYGTYTMIENRVLTLGAAAVLASLKRRPWLAGSLWALTAMQKPQIFVFWSAFWVGAELMRGMKPTSVTKILRDGTCIENSRQALRDWWLHERALKNVCQSYMAAAAVSGAWFAWSNWLDARSDLPWIIHTGPRAMKWYFGDWHERFTLGFAGRFFGAWLKESGLGVALPALLVLGFVATLGKEKGAGKRLAWRKQCVWLVRGCGELLWRGLPLFLALGAYFYLFYAVFIVHEYYALPMNFGRMLTTAGVLAAFIGLVVPPGHRFAKNARLAASLKSREQWAPLACWIVVAAVVGHSAATGVRAYAEFAANINNPNTSFYQTEWNRQVFPEQNSFVVVAGPGNGRDLLELYFTKQRGFVWCSNNEAFAPRAYWKAQGVRYVAWTKQPDPVSRHYSWTVRTMDQELAFARLHHWSSDVDDVWAARSMAEWAALASRTGNDPCLGSPDPRLWK